MVGFETDAAPQQKQDLRCPVLLSHYGVMKCGYARDQNPALQLAALKRAGCKSIFKIKDEGLSGATANRSAPIRCLKKDYGATLVVWKLDRLGRSLRDLIAMLDDLKQRGVKFASLTKAIDTSTTCYALLRVMHQNLRPREIKSEPHLP